MSEGPGCPVIPRHTSEKFGHLGRTGLVLTWQASSPRLMSPRARLPRLARPHPTAPDSSLRPLGGFSTRSRRRRRLAQPRRPWRPRGLLCPSMPMLESWLASRQRARKTVPFASCPSTTASGRHVDTSSTRPASSTTSWSRGSLARAPSALSAAAPYTRHCPSRPRRRAACPSRLSLFRALAVAVTSTADTFSPTWEASAEREVRSHRALARFRLSEPST